MTEKLSPYERRAILEARLHNLKSGRGEYTASTRADAIADCREQLTLVKREIANAQHWAAM